ncbi:hypothetical protein MLD38_022084 [Melastoma candidum]|uniref:Uncharacterized protein n=1 Tax=Melastoma candidum TaxID=119954 RepID=A0ACB9QLI6_9MYRT|nr:hypothetical protein MLD38_022084 [Melastoma candidum]
MLPAVNEYDSDGEWTDTGNDAIKFVSMSNLPCQDLQQIPSVSWRFSSIFLALISKESSARSICVSLAVFGDFSGAVVSELDGNSKGLLMLKSAVEDNILAGEIVTDSITLLLYSLDLMKEVFLEILLLSQQICLSGVRLHLALCFYQSFCALRCLIPLVEFCSHIPTRLPRSYPGVFAVEKQRTQQAYDFTDFRRDIIKARDFSTSSLCGHDDKIHVVLSNADLVDIQQLMRVYGKSTHGSGKPPTSGRLPDAEQFKEVLAGHGMDKFEKLKQKTIQSVDDMLAHNIPNVTYRSPIASLLRRPTSRPYMSTTAQSPF